MVKLSCFWHAYFVIVLTLLVLLYWKNYHHSFLYWFILPVKKFTVFHLASCTKLLRCRKWRTGCRSLTCRIAVKMFVLQKRVMRRRPSLAAVDLRLQINPALPTCLPRGVWTVDLLPTLLWPSHLWSAGTDYEYPLLRVHTLHCVWTGPHKWYPFRQVIYPLKQYPFGEVWLYSPVALSGQD